MRTVLTIVLLLLTSVALAQDDAESTTLLFRDTAPDANAVELMQVAEGFNRPLYITHANDGSGRLFVVEQGGKVLIIEGGAVLPQPFLDVTSLLTWDVNAGGFTERGLLGLAFHPNYGENGEFFIHYNDTDGATVVARYRVTTDNPNFADPSSREIVFTLAQPFSNHNGGQLEFGPDGYLYIGLGDGGSANDPLNAGQNPNTLLGTIIRIDVDNGTPYSIPESNPFANNNGGAGEVWAYGLRNPWRFSFDRATGDLYIGDVGQNQWEEINFQPADSGGGENYGWNLFEGSNSFAGGGAPDAVVMPVAEYDHNQGCSITAGYIYRGEAIPELQAAYLYGDWCSGNIWVAYRNKVLGWQSELFLTSNYRISSFAEDEEGELYLIDYGGSLLKFIPAQ